MRSYRSLMVVVALAGMLALGGRAARAQFSPVYNGSFEKLAADGVTPDGWKAEGNEALVQTLTREKDPQRGFVAKLSCTKFAAGMHDSHVMLAQQGRVGVEKDKWYRVSLWARCADLPAAVAQVQLRNNVTWPPELASSLRSQRCMATLRVRLPGQAGPQARGRPVSQSTSAAPARSGSATSPSSRQRSRRPSASRPSRCRPPATPCPTAASSAAARVGAARPNCTSAIRPTCSACSANRTAPGLRRESLMEDHLLRRRPAHALR